MQDDPGNCRRIGRHGNRALIIIANPYSFNYAFHCFWNSKIAKKPIFSTEVTWWWNGDDWRIPGGKKYLPHIWQMLADNMKAFIQCVSENTVPDIRNRCDNQDTSFIARRSRCSSSMTQAPVWKSESLTFSPASVTDLLGDLGCLFPSF